MFNTVMFIAAFALLALQPVLPLNPDLHEKGMLAPTTIFNTAVSFLTNTNLQHYAGEQHLSYFSQLTAILWNMFVSAAVGFCAWRRSSVGCAAMRTWAISMSIFGVSWPTFSCPRVCSWGSC